MIDLIDLRTAGHWGALPLLRLLAGDGIPQVPLPRYVLRFACLHCERHYVGTDPGQQYCPDCDRPLRFTGEWDLCREYAPKWWADPGARP